VLLFFQQRFRSVRMRRMLAHVDSGAAAALKEMSSEAAEKRRRWQAAVRIQKVYRGYKDRQFLTIKRAVIERDMRRLRDAYRAHLLRQRADKIFKPFDANPIKTFFAFDLSVAAFRVELSLPLLRVRIRALHNSPHPIHLSRDPEQGLASAAAGRRWRHNLGRRGGKSSEREHVQRKLEHGREHGEMVSSAERMLVECELAQSGRSRGSRSMQDRRHGFRFPEKKITPVCDQTERKPVNKNEKQANRKTENRRTKPEAGKAILIRLFFWFFPVSFCHFLSTRICFSMIFVRFGCRVLLRWRQMAQGTKYQKRKKQHRPRTMKGRGSR
jgi:hypothetical protein